LIGTPEPPVSSPADQPQARFQALLDRHRGILFQIANAYARSLEDRRDLAQEISAQLWRAFPRYDDRRPFPTWMYRVALNVGISFARSAARRSSRTVTLDEQALEAGVEPPEWEGDGRVRALRRFLDRLDDLSRSLLILYLDDRSYREIAEVLGISESNVGTKLNRLKRRIRDEVEG
jgi:RNA polymerase sigma-70 factor (ECF subfamily)